MEQDRRIIRWMDTLPGHFRAHRFAASGLALGVLTVLLLLAQSLLHLVVNGSSAVVRYALLGGSAGFLATAMGALPALFLSGIPQKAEDTMLGLAAGMMLLSGIQILSIGVLAEYIGRIYEEVKRRPTYLIAHDEDRSPLRDKP